MSAYQELKEQAEELLRQAEQLRAEERDAVLANVRATIKEWGFTEGDLGFRSTNKDKRKAFPKYRNSHGQEWSGRGKTPKWLKQELDAGANKNDFLIAA